MAKLTHIDQQGNARMVEVGEKEMTRRTAIAEGIVNLSDEAFTALVEGNLKKGDALGTARIAAILAAKKTHEIIPLCHPLCLTGIDVDLEPELEGHRVRIRVEVRAYDRTGVEMEALNAVSTAALTIYDMCKAIDREITITDIRLREKSGGKSGDYRR